MSINPENHELELERLFAAGPESLFEGFIEIYDGAERPDWVQSSELDLRIGGEWTVQLKPSETEPFTEVRTITELDRPKRLAYSMTTHRADLAEPVSTEVGLSFQQRSGQTLVKLNQRGFRGEQQADMFERSWTQLLALLSERVDG